MSDDRLSAAIHAALIVAASEEYEHADSAPTGRFLRRASALVTDAVRRQLQVPEPNPTGADGTPIVLWSAEFGHLYTDVDSFPLSWRGHAPDAVALTPVRAGTEETPDV